MKHLNKQSGMTMIELLIALAIFAIITGAIFSLYINSNRSYNEDEIFARMQENGRFALNRIAQDLDMVDFWGEMIDTGTITVVPTGWGEDCDLGLDTPSTTASPGLQFYNAASPGSFTPTSSGCSAVIGTLNPNTNALGIKRVANGPVTVAANYITNGIYLRTNGFDGSLIQTDGNLPSDPDYADWLYLPVIYYIKNDAETNSVPFLCRAGTNGLKAIAAVNDAEDDCLAEGVQKMHIEFGIDTDSDGVANQYMDDTTTNAVTARIYLLVRSGRAVPSYTNSKTYKLGTLATLGPFNDGFYRRVFSTTVVLRNPKAFLLLNL